MHGISAGARLDDLDVDTRSQWIGRGKQYLSYGIQTVHDGRFMHDMYARVGLDDLHLVLVLGSNFRSFDLASDSLPTEPPRHPKGKLCTL